MTCEETEFCMGVSVHYDQTVMLERLKNFAQNLQQLQKILVDEGAISCLVFESLGFQDLTKTLLIVNRDSPTCIRVRRGW